MATFTPGFGSFNILYYSGSCAECKRNNSKKLIMEQGKNLTERESLDLITQMINRAKNSFHDTGIGAMMWGAVIAICSLVRLSELHFGYRLPFDIYLLTVAAIVLQIFITIKEKKKRRGKSY